MQTGRIRVNFARLLLEGAAPGDLMRAAPAVIAAELQLDYVEVYELRPTGDAVRLMGSTGPDPTAIGSVQRLDPNSLLAAAAQRAGEPVVVSDWLDETHLQLTPALRDAGIASSVGVAIGVGHGERVYGFLSAHSRAPRPFPDAEIEFLEMVGDLLGYALATARSTLSFCTLVENAPDGIVWFDRDLRMCYVNPAVERITGTPAPMLLGRTSGDLGIPESLVPTWELVLRQVWRTGHGQAFELRLSTPMGERVFDSRIVPVPDVDGTVRSLLTISHDVTEQRRAETDRVALFEQLVAQQNLVQELMAQDQQRLRDRTAPVLAPETLNYRERHMLRLIAAGLTNREIGAEIGLAIGTVKNHIATILSKLNVSDRTQAAVRAVELGLVRPDAEP
ncbi:MAG TPA: PAS domain-containing protein [Chloroflexota bacterium]|nr:PAS domain-containing protein [Chloroflexota bacterium]